MPLIKSLSRARYVFKYVCSLSLCLSISCFPRNADAPLVSFLPCVCDASFGLCFAVALAYLRVPQRRLSLTRMGKLASPLAVVLFCVRGTSLASLGRCWSRTSSAPGIVSASGAPLAVAAARPSHRGYGPGCSSHRTAAGSPCWWPYGHHSYSEVLVGASTRGG